MLSPILVLSFVSFALHYVWESAHIGLYTAYEGIGGPLPVTLYATIGDVLYVLLAYALFALAFRDVHWLRKASLSAFVLLALLGLLIALGVEWKAMLQHRWQYTELMPTVFGFGLSPLAQMMLLLPLSMYLTKLYTADKRKSSV